MCFGCIHSLSSILCSDFEVSFSSYNLKNQPKIFDSLPQGGKSEVMNVDSFMFDFKKLIFIILLIILNSIFLICFNCFKKFKSTSPSSINNLLEYLIGTISPLSSNLCWAPKLANFLLILSVLNIFLNLEQ